MMKHQEQNKVLVSFVVLLLLIGMFGFLAGQIKPVYATGITRVQGNARGTITSGTSISVTMDSTPTSGNVLIAAIATDDNNPPPIVSSISQIGVTWTYQVRASDPIAEGAEIWFGIVSSGASTSVTISLNASATEGAVAACGGREFFVYDSDGG